MAQLMLIDLHSPSERATMLGSAGRHESQCARPFRTVATTEEEQARLKDAGSNPFIEPERLQEFVAEKEQEFRTELAKQKADAQEGLCEAG
jgi:hypothetical protein